MKRLLTLLLLLAAVLQLSAQKPVADRRPLWVGLDMGGTWQTSDMKPVGGIGWSFTLSRYSRLSKTGPLYFGWRFRFMDGRNFGYTYHPLSTTQLLAEPTLTTAHPGINYTQAPSNGTAFANYKMHFDEFAFELIVGSNGLRKHGVLLYGFGGAGLNYWKTKTDQVSLTGGMYDYSSMTLTGNESEASTQLDGIRDHEYETTTQSGKWSFMPSAGIGMGYQWGNGVALGVEHRTTWALNDMIDGITHDAAGAATKNDLYNYDGFFVRWTFGGNSDHSVSHTDNPPPPNPNQYTNNTTNNNTPPNNTVVNPPPPNNNNNNTPPQNTTVYPPKVRFTTPSSDPYSTAVVNQQLVVRVENVNYSSQISLLINNQASTNFSFNPNTNTMVFTHTLQPGTNVYQVTATNSAGSASDVQTIIFKEGSNTTTVTQPTVPPTVTITNPPTDPYTSTVQAMTVNATVLNVASASNVQVRRNGSPVNNFTFDPNTHIVTFAANLQTGSNLYEVIGTNNYGSASDAVTINYNPAPAMQPPVVTITSPSACPYSTKVSAFTITANITNVTAANQVSVVFNNQMVTNFTFTAHGANATISLPVTLLPGLNTFAVTGTNAAGTDTKSCQITYKVSAQQTVPPMVTITNPGVTPYTSSTPSMTLNATVLNVNSAAEIAVQFNSAAVTNFTYDMNTHVLAYNATFVNGNNTFKVTASNANGSDSKTATIIYTLKPGGTPPVVTITIPANDPYVTTNPIETVKATVLNVTSASQIVVRDGNNATVNFNYNAAANQITFQTPQMAKGMNPFTITATTPYGTGSDATNIKLVPGDPVDLGRPGGAGGGTHGGSGNVTQTPVTPDEPVNLGRPGGAGDVQTTTAHSSTPIVISLVNPAGDNSTVASSSMTVAMNITGAASASEITVKVNGTPLPAGSVVYNAATGLTKFTVTLNSGTNTIMVSVQNSSGSASRTITITSAATGRTANPGSGSGSSGASPRNAETKPAPKSGETSQPVKSSETTAPSRPSGTPTTAPSTPRGGTSGSSGSGSRPR